MARYFARMVRAVLVAFLGLGGGIGLLTFMILLLGTGQQKALSIGLQSAVIVGLCFGCFFALILFLSDLSMRLFVSHGRYAEIWELEQARELEIPAPIKDVKRFCREALLVVPNVSTISETEDQLGMSAKTGPSWKSAGELLEVSITPMSENRFKVRCVSKPRRHDVAFDYAKNFENVEAWLGKVLSFLSGATPV